MKCPKCQHNHLRRSGLVCNNCRYTFVFDPKVDGITDGKFKKLIESVSSNNTYYFTMNQLFSAYCRMPIAKTDTGCAGCGGCFAMLLGIGAIVWGGLHAGGAQYRLVGYVVDSIVIVAALAGPGIFLLTVGAALLIAARRRPKPRPSDERLNGWLGKWEGAGRPISKLLRQPSLDHAPNHPYRESDIYDYGVERLLIVQHDLHVDLFVKNGFHAEHRALVVSENGYPRYLVETARKFLSERPDLPVILLHDSTPEGLAMKDRLARSTVYPLAGRPMNDAGLFPQNIHLIKSIEDTRPNATGGQVPVDFLPYGALAAGLAGAVGTGMLMTTAIAQAQAAPGGTGDASGGADFG